MNCYCKQVLFLQFKIIFLVGKWHHKCTPATKLKGSHGVSSCLIAASKRWIHSGHKWMDMASTNA